MSLRVNEPVPLVSATKSVVPSPNAARALAIEMTVVARPVPDWVKPKSPESRWPATTMATFVPSTLRYGPAGRSSTTVVPSSSKVWLTSGAGVDRDGEGAAELDHVAGDEEPHGAADPAGDARRRS